MFKKKQKTMPKSDLDESLIQTTITKFFNSHNGPLQFDSKPLIFSNKMKNRSSRKRTKFEKNLLASEDSTDGELPSDTKLKLSGKRNRSRNKTKLLKTIKSDSDDDVQFVGEYKLPEKNADVDKENDGIIPLSPNIVLHLSGEDIQFKTETDSKLLTTEQICQRNKTNGSNRETVEDNACPNLTSKKSEKESDVKSIEKKRNDSVASDHGLDKINFSAQPLVTTEDEPSTSFSRVTSSTPVKELSITRSERQITEVRKRSRILQMNSSSFSNCSNASTSEFITTDFMHESSLNSQISDTTLTCSQDETRNVSTTTVNFMTEIELDRTVIFNKTITKEAIGDVEIDAHTIESRRMYHLDLVDKIVNNANKTHLNSLLFDSDRRLLKDYNSLPNKYKFLCCKLFTYTAKWHDLNKFVAKIKIDVSSSEISRMHQNLVVKNIISNDFSFETSAYLLDLLEANDVKDIHKSFKLKSKNATKPALIRSILEHSNRQTTLTTTKSMDKIVRDKIRLKLGLRVKLTDSFYSMFYKIHLLYSFANPEFAKPSDLYLFMSQIKNGEIVMPNVTREEKTIFNDAEEFSRFSKACCFKNELLLEFDKKKKSDNMKELCRVIFVEFKKLLEERNCSEDDDRPAYVKQFSAGNKYASALSFACKHLTIEFPNEVKDWLELLLSQINFCQRKRGFWYCQLSMVSHRYLKDPEKAAEVLVTALRDKKLSMIDLREISHRGKTYCRPKSMKITQSVREELSSLLVEFPDSNDLPSIVIDAVSNHSGESGMKSQYRMVNAFGDTEYLSVEQVALNHYVNKKGFLKGIHCEGDLMTTIFCVLFWDILFSQTVARRVPFAFISDLQYLPLDFFATDFYFNRQVEIEDKLNKIRVEWSLEYLQDYVDTIWNNLSRTKSLISPNIVADSTELYNVILCIGREVVSEVCRRLVEHYREHRAGMPDLFLWNAVTRKSKFVEVKGPGDKLSTKQKTWLEFLKSFGADVEVCHVHPVGSNRSQKYKSRPKMSKAKVKRKKLETDTSDYEFEKK